MQINREYSALARRARAAGVRLAFTVLDSWAYIVGGRVYECPQSFDRLDALRDAFGARQAEEVDEEAMEIYDDGDLMFAL